MSDAALGRERKFSGSIKRYPKYNFASEMNLSHSLEKGKSDMGQSVMPLPMCQRRK